MHVDYKKKFVLKFSFSHLQKKNPVTSRELGQQLYRNIQKWSIHVYIFGNRKIMLIFRIWHLFLHTWSHNKQHVHILLSFAQLLCTQALVFWTQTFIKGKRLMKKSILTLLKLLWSSWTWNKKITDQNKSVKITRYVDFMSQTKKSNEFLKNFESDKKKNVLYF